MIRQTNTRIQVNKEVIRCLVLFLLITGSNAVAQNLNGKLAYSKLLVDRANSPTNEFIFPTVIRASDHIVNPLGTYYMYYAPHDAPGGIYMAYSNSISGPYTVYSGNPIVRNNHQGKFNVSHVSSPHVVWMPQYNKYFMYFHGENTTTRWAHSTNGVTWDLADDNIALRTADWGSDFTECSYAKVYEYTIPGIGDRYTMVTMLIRSGFGRRIALATSNDGKKFTPRDQALISQGPGEGTDISGPSYWVNNGRHYIVYHGSSGNIYSTEVGSGFNLENHMGVFFDPGSGFPEFNKAADPFLFYAENKWNMFYTVGLRLEQSIGFAVEVVTAYKDCNYTGTAVALPVGDYTLAQLNSRGILNNDISSLRVAPGYRITLYDTDNFTGASLVLTAENSCLVGAGWNDRATSARVATNTSSFSSTIEAESYSSMSGVMTETCSEGGLNVGSFDTGDWTAYNVNIPAAGTYKVTYRVASIYTGRTLRLERANGTVQLGTITIPNTGNWQAWTSVSHNVSLPAGAYTIGIATSSGGFNINRFNITNNLSARSATEDEISPEENYAIYPNQVDHTLTMKGSKGGTLGIVNTQGIQITVGFMETDDKDVSYLPTGVYHAVLIKNNQRIVKRFMKK